jgi:phosphatidylglycerophosphate synthase
MSERVLNSSRNSRAREVTRGAINLTVRFLHKTAPWLTPNEITIGGMVGVAGVAKYADSISHVKIEDSFFQRLTAAVVYTGLCLSDGLDGALERHLQSLDPKRKGSSFGANLDAGSDRAQELVLALSRASSADNRNDRFGKALALGAAVTNTLPSLVRAYGESKGVIFEENGSNWLQFFGTRLGRAIVGGVSSLAPEYKGIPIQKAADALTIVSNVSTTVSRWRRIRAHNSESVLSEEDKSSASTRFKMLAAIEGSAIAGASWFLRKPKS